MEKKVDQEERIARPPPACLPLGQWLQVWLPHGKERKEKEKRPDCFQRREEAEAGHVLRKGAPFMSKLWVNVLGTHLVR